MTSIRSPPIRAFSSDGGPSATTRPRSRTTIASASRSASSRYWVVRISVVPASTSPRSSSHRSLRACGSSPVVGSSRNRHLGLAHQAGREVQPAAHAAGEGPHEAVADVGEAELLEQLLRALRARAPAAGGRGARPSRGWRARSAARRRSHTGPRGRCAPAPARGAPTTSTPATLARPVVGIASVVRMRIAVVLPAPLWPEQPEHGAPRDVQVRPRGAPTARRSACRDPRRARRRLAASCRCPLELRTEGT